MIIRNRIFEIIADKTFTDVSAIHEDADLRNDLAMDSLEHLDVVCDCEREFGIVITDEDINAIRTVGDLVETIKRKTKNKE